VISALLSQPGAVQCVIIEEQGVVEIAFGQPYLRIIFTKVSQYRVYCTVQYQGALVVAPG
jgi:hypothetical protein